MTLRSILRTITNSFDTEDRVLCIIISAEAVTVVYSLRDSKGRRRRVEVRCSQAVEDAVFNFMTPARRNALIDDTYERAVNELA